MRKLEPESRGFLVAPPVPTMPPGLVMLMEDMSRSVLQNNPEDIYAFCAEHMKKLLILREQDDDIPKKEETLEEKITRVQAIVRKKAEKRRALYDSLIAKTLQQVINQSSTDSVVGKQGEVINKDINEKVEPSNIELEAQHIESKESSDENLEEKTQETTKDNDHLYSESVVNNNLFQNALSCSLAVIEPNTASKPVETASDTHYEHDVKEMVADKLNSMTADMNNASIDKIEEIAQTVTETVTAIEEVAVNTVMEMTKDSNEDSDQVITEANVLNGEFTANENEEQKSTINENVFSIVETELSEPTPQIDDLIVDKVGSINTNETAYTNEVNNTVELTKSQTDPLVSSGKNDEFVNIEEENLEPQHRIKDEAKTQLMADTLSDTFTESLQDNKDKNETEIEGTFQINENTTDVKNHAVVLPLLRQNTVEIVTTNALPESKLETPIDIHNHETTVAASVLLDVGDNDVVVDTTDIQTDPNVQDNEIIGKININTTVQNVITNAAPVDEASVTSENQCKDNVNIENMERTDLIKEQPQTVIADQNDDNKLQAEYLDVNQKSAMEMLAENASVNEIHTMKSEDSLDESLIKQEIIESQTPVHTDSGTSSIKVVENVPQNAEMDLETAAITIQKVFRSFMYKGGGSTLDDDNSYATTIDNTSEDLTKADDVGLLSSNKERRTLGITRMDTVLQTVNEEKSLSLSDDSSLSSAATVIQSHVRGYLVRSKLHNTTSSSLTKSIPSSEGESEKQNKKILNIHIIPDGTIYLNRDESAATSIDLPLDKSPPVLTSYHSLSYDITERRKLLKREDAIQSISPPSNNSGKSDEIHTTVNLQEGIESLNNIENIKGDEREENEVLSGDTSPTKSSTAETVIEVNRDIEGVAKTNVAPAKHSLEEVDISSLSTSGEKSVSMQLEAPSSVLLHSSEFHDVIIPPLPTAVTRSDPADVARGE